MKPGSVFNRMRRHGDVLCGWDADDELLSENGAAFVIWFAFIVRDVACPPGHTRIMPVVRRRHSEPLWFTG